MIIFIIIICQLADNFEQTVVFDAHTSSDTGYDQFVYTVCMLVLVAFFLACETLH